MNAFPDQSPTALGDHSLRDFHLLADSLAFYEKSILQKQR
jgi:hypothetical protein